MRSHAPCTTYRAPSPLGSHVPSIAPCPLRGSMPSQVSFIYPLLGCHVPPVTRYPSAELYPLLSAMYPSMGCCVPSIAYLSPQGALRTLGHHVLVIAPQSLFVRPRGSIPSRALHHPPCGAIFSRPFLFLPRDSMLSRTTCTPYSDTMFLRPPLVPSRGSMPSCAPCIMYCALPPCGAIFSRSLLGSR